MRGDDFHSLFCDYHGVFIAEWRCKRMCFSDIDLVEYSGMEAAFSPGRCRVACRLCIWYI